MDENNALADVLVTDPATDRAFPTKYIVPGTLLIYFPAEKMPVIEKQLNNPGIDKRRRKFQIFGK